MKIKIYQTLPNEVDVQSKTHIIVKKKTATVTRLNVN